MSDPTNPDGDFRGNRGSKRQQETVMLGADALSGMVEQAKAAPAVPDAAAPPEPAASGPQRLVLIGVGVVVLIAVVALVVLLVR